MKSSKVCDIPVSSLIGSAMLTTTTKVYLKTLFLYLLSSIPYSAISQDFETVYYNSKWEITSTNYASYYRKSGFDSNSLEFDSLVTDFYLNGSPEMVGRYNKGIKEGQFIFYYPDSTIKLIANYKNNRRSGIWTTFHENGTKNMVVEYNDEKEKLLEFFDQNGDMILKNLSGKYSFDLYYDYTFRVFSKFPLGDNPQKYSISGSLKNGLKSGEWTIIRHGEMGTRKGDGSWKTVKTEAIVCEFKYEEGNLLEGWGFISDFETVAIEHDTLTYILPEPAKINITESLFREPGQMIRQNYVIKAIMDYDKKLVKLAEPEDESELKEFFSSNFSKYVTDCSRSIILTIELGYDAFGGVHVISISPKGITPLEKEVHRIIALISKVKNYSQQNFSFTHRVQCIDELDYKK